VLQSLEHDLDHGDADHGLATGWVLLVVLAQAAIAPEPAKGALHDSALGQYHKALLVIVARDDLQRPARHRRDPAHQLAAVATVGPEQRQARETSHQRDDHELGSRAVLDAGRVDHHHEQQAQRVYRARPLASFDLLACVIATDPPFSVVLTLWLSMIAALGLSSRPSLARTWVRSASWMRSQTPVIRQLR